MPGQTVVKDHIYFSPILQNSKGVLFNALTIFYPLSNIVYKKNYYHPATHKLIAMFLTLHAPKPFIHGKC